MFKRVVPRDSCDAEDIAKFLEGRQGVQAALEGDQHTAEAVTDLITSLASGNPDVQFQLLEQVAAQVGSP